MGNHSDDDDMDDGEELSALVGNEATVHGRAWKEREKEHELKEVPFLASGRSERPGGSRSTAADLGDRR